MNATWGYIASDVDAEAWHFKLGEWVTHKDRPLPPLVMGQVRTRNGRAVYGVRSFMNVIHAATG